MTISFLPKINIVPSRNNHSGRPHVKIKIEEVLNLPFFKRLSCHSSCDQLELRIDQMTFESGLILKYCTSVKN